MGHYDCNKCGYYGCSGECQYKCEECGSECSSNYGKERAHWKDGTSTQFCFRCFDKYSKWMNNEVKPTITVKDITHISETVIDVNDIINKSYFSICDKYKVINDLTDRILELRRAEIKKIAENIYNESIAQDKDAYEYYKIK